MCVYVYLLHKIKKIFFVSDLKKTLVYMEKTVHLKRGTKNLGKRSEFEALVQMKQIVNHSETTARNKFQKSKRNHSLTLLGAARQPAPLFFKARFFQNLSHASQNRARKQVVREPLNLRSAEINCLNCHFCGNI